MFDRTAIKTAVGLLLAAGILTLCFHQVSASDPWSAYYSPATDQMLWFIQTSDTHIGASGTQDSDNLRWLVSTGKNVIQPSFIVVTGDLTDSTNGNLFGYPNGPYQSEWDEYKNILAANGVTGQFYYDLPGNHDAYNDAPFDYYLANSIQKQTQFSWSRTVGGKEYHFLAVNTADNSGDPFSLLPPYGDYAGLDSGELSFIAADLDKYSTSNLTMVFGHHPLISTGNSQDTYVYYGATAFESLLDGHGIPLYGHGHAHDYYQGFFTTNMDPGMFYFRVASLAKSSSNQYRIIAIDCNGISSLTQTVRTWPAVVITAPVDSRLGGVANPFAYTVPDAAANPIRALVFDPYTPSVQYQIDASSASYAMTRVGIGPVWQGTWNATGLAEGEHTIKVTATSASGTRSHTIRTYVKPEATQTKTMQSSAVETGWYQTNKRTGTTYVKTTTFTRGTTVILRTTLTSGTAPVANASVRFVINGLFSSAPAPIAVTSAPSNSAGVAEAQWRTTAPSKRGSVGTPTGTYSIGIDAVTVAGYLWDGNASAADVIIK